MIIAQLNYNNEDLIIYEENKNIYFGKIQNNKITTEIKEETKQLLIKVYKKLIINKNTSIECGTFKIKDKQIKIYYDKQTNLYYFYELNNNKLQIPDKELLKQLNLYYNNQSETLYHIESIETNKEQKQVKRLIKLNTVIVSIIISANIAYQELPNLNYNLYYQTTKIPKISKENTYSFQKINKAIDTNPNLTEYEKYCTKLLKTELDENKKYIDQETICENLNNIKIQYHKTKNPKQEEIIGTYKVRGPHKNEINIYNTEFPSHIPKTLFHELNHSITKRAVTNDIMMDNPNYVEEMTNELFTKEYFEEIAQTNNLDNYESYGQQMLVMYPLCEILSEETIKTYKFNNQMNIILEELLTLDKDITKAANLITAINALNLYEKNIKELAQEIVKEPNKEEKYKLVTKYNKAREEAQNNKQTIYNLIKNYYQKKYKTPITEDQIMMVYFSDRDLNIPEAKEKIESMYRDKNNEENFYIMQIKPKGYISKKYKTTHSYVELTYRQNKIECKIRIDNTNRLSNKKISPSEIINENNKTR